MLTWPLRIHDASQSVASLALLAREGPCHTMRVLFAVPSVILVRIWCTLSEGSQRIGHLCCSQLSSCTCDEGLLQQAAPAGLTCCCVAQR